MYCVSLRGISTASYSLWGKYEHVLCRVVHGRFNVRYSWRYNLQIQPHRHCDDPMRITIVGSRGLYTYRHKCNPSDAALPVGHLGAPQREIICPTRLSDFLATLHIWRRAQAHGTSVVCGKLHARLHACMFVLSNEIVCKTITRLACGISALPVKEWLCLWLPACRCSNSNTYVYGRMMCVCEARVCIVPREGCCSTWISARVQQQCFPRRGPPQTPSLQAASDPCRWPEIYTARCSDLSVSS